MMRPDSPQWIVAKAEGDRAEIAVANWFQTRGYDVYRTLGPARFDLLLQCAVEVKRDLVAGRTGNVAVEIKHNGQPSGILTTSASYWAIVLKSELVIVRAENLRLLVLRERFPERAAGDNHSSTVKLVPVERIKSIRGAQIVTLREAAAETTEHECAIAGDDHSEN